MMPLESAGDDEKAWPNSKPRERGDNSGSLLKDGLLLVNICFGVAGIVMIIGGSVVVQWGLEDLCSKCSHLANASIAFGVLLLCFAMFGVVIRNKTSPVLLLTYVLMLIILTLSVFGITISALVYDGENFEMEEGWQDLKDNGELQRMCSIQESFSCSGWNSCCGSPPNANVTITSAPSSPPSAGASPSVSPTQSITAPSVSPSASPSASGTAAPTQSPAMPSVSPSVSPSSPSVSPTSPVPGRAARPLNDPFCSWTSECSVDCGVSNLNPKGCRTELIDQLHSRVVPFTVFMFLVLLVMGAGYYGIWRQMKRPVDVADLSQSQPTAVASNPESYIQVAG